MRPKKETEKAKNLRIFRDLLESGVSWAGVLLASGLGYIIGGISGWTILKGMSEIFCIASSLMMTVTFIFMDNYATKIEESQ